jgi:hypothetical protein
MRHPHCSLIVSRLSRDCLCSQFAFVYGPTEGRQECPFLQKLSDRVATERERHIANSSYALTCDLTGWPAVGARLAPRLNARQLNVGVIIQDEQHQTL